MKKYVSYISILGVMLFLACREDEILLSKPGEEVSPVTNLAYTLSGSDVNLTWSLPADLPDDIVSPVSVQVRATIDGHNGGTVTLANDPTSYIFPGYDPSKKYRFTVKVMASVDTDDPAVSDLRYSPGQTITF
jgi:hypothetical protein